MPQFHPMYAVPIRDVISKGTAEEMKAFKTVSDYMQSKADAVDDDWKAAHAELEQAIDKAG